MNHRTMDAFMPHGMCYPWRPDTLALHVGSDLLIALACFSIPSPAQLEARNPTTSPIC